MDRGRFFRLVTHHGSVVAEDRRHGEVVSVADAAVGDEYPVLFAWVADDRPSICFLVSGQAARLTMRPGLVGEGIIPLGLARDRSGSASLYDLHSGMWVCAVPPGGEGAPAGPLVIARKTVAAFEVFSLVPVLKVFVPSTVTEMTARIGAMLDEVLDPARLGTMPVEDAPVLSAVARVLPLDRLEALSRALLASPENGRVLGRLFPDDIMGREGLPGLAEWVVGRDRSVAPPVQSRLFGLRLSRAAAPVPQASPAPQPEPTLTTELDSLATLGFGGEYVSLPYACIALARRHVVPRRDLCIIATARNEGIYILEWLAYHRAIGAEAVFLYTNDNDDGSDALLAALARGGALCWTRSEVAAGGNAQQKAYGHALGVRPEVLDYRWALVIDLDEYFVFNPALFRDAREFVRWQETRPCDAIALNWVFHGSGGVARWQDEFIARRFPHPGGGADIHIKTMCRPNRFMHSTPHFPLTWRKLPFVFHSSTGDEHVPLRSGTSLAHSDQPSKEYAWINHYFFKSTEEFLLKWSRNRGDHATVAQPTNTLLTAGFVELFMQQFSAKLTAPTHAEECAPGFEAELARLLRLPGVAEAWTGVKQSYAERVKAIVPLFVDAPGVLEAGEAGRAFLETLGLSRG